MLHRQQQRQRIKTLKTVACQKMRHYKPPFMRLMLQEVEVLLAVEELPVAEELPVVEEPIQHPVVLR
jgi:hypothetical protein